MRSLAIDDEFVALSKMTLLLEPFGACDAATSAQQALDLFCQAIREGDPYQLVTIDINMPDMNGLTLLGRLQREEQARGCPRAKKLIVTAASTPRNVQAAVSGECDGFLVKPVRREVLLTKLTALGLLPDTVAPPATGG
jgi:two-component system chemotaxis response regulator CheY